jgi:hypothetical protein
MSNVFAGPLWYARWLAYDTGSNAHWLAALRWRHQGKIFAANARADRRG